MRIFSQSLINKLLGAAVAAVLLTSSGANAQEKKWKDGEYEFYQKIQASKNPDEQLALLKQWEEKFPDSDFKLERAQANLVVCNQKGDANCVYGASKKLLTIDPKSFQALYFLTAMTMSSNKVDPEGLETGVKASNGILGLLDTIFAADKKPQGVDDAGWKKQRVDTEVLALKTLGWVEQQKKDFAKAEDFFKKALDVNPMNAEMSYFLGTVIVQQKKVERQSEAMWHFARAGNLEGAYALDPARKGQVAAYFKRVFTAFAGDDAKAMQDLVNQAKANPYPPAGFKIKSKEEKMLENEEKFKSENPMLFMFMQVKNKLAAADGETYWGELKDAELPEFKGKLVSQSPETNPKELVVAISTADQPEVTLVLEKPLRGKADVGTELTFVAVAKEYTKEPFSLKAEVENEKLKGWPVTGPAPKTAPAKKTPVGAKKAAPKKK